VEYFVSYYDYYQPEAYIARSDTYIEKDSSRNDEIDRLRLSATRSLFSRSDVLIVASVSCIYGLGDPDAYGDVVVSLQRDEVRKRDKLLRQLTHILYERNDIAFTRGTFRVRGDVVEIYPAYEQLAIRIEFFGDTVERIVELDPLTGEIMASRDSVDIYPARHFVTTDEKLKLAMVSIEDELHLVLNEMKGAGKVLEAARLEQRTMFDLEMMRETGFCNGVENYARHLSQREPGSRPWTLLDYFPDDFLLFVDESHMALPQVQGMYFGDRLARKRWWNTAFGCRRRWTTGR
jgi:excinuclease ABC subunit B